MPTVGPAAEQRTRCPDVAPGGGSARQMEKNPILHILHLREPDATVHTASEHYLNLACFYLRQERCQVKAVQTAQYALEASDDDMTVDPVGSFIACVKARLLNCVVYSMVKQDHERAFGYAFEANAIMDVFWEERQDQVLNVRFWHQFADVKGRVLKALAFEAEFIRLPKELRVELWRQCDIFFKGNNMLLNPEPPEDVQNPMLFGNQNEPSWRRPAALKNKGSPSASSSPASGGSRSPMTDRSPNGRGRDKNAALMSGFAGRQTAIVETNTQLVPTGSTDYDSNDPLQIHKRAMQRYEKIADREKKKEQISAFEKSRQALSSTTELPDAKKEPAEKKVQGLIPGSRLSPDEMSRARAQWMVEIKVKQATTKKEGTRAEKVSQQTASPGPADKAAGVTSKSRNCFEEFQVHDAATSKNTKFSGKVKAFLTAETRGAYRKWKWGMKSKIRVCHRDAMEFPDTLFEKKVLYSGEGLASQKRRKRLPGMRTRDQAVQRGLLVGGVKMNITNLKLVMGHHGRLCKYGLDDEAAKKRALAELKTEMGEDLNKVKKVYKLAEGLYEKFDEAGRLSSMFRKNQKRGGANRKTLRVDDGKETKEEKEANEDEDAARVDDEEEDDEEKLEAEKKAAEAEKERQKKKMQAAEMVQGETLDFVREGIGAQLLKGQNAMKLQKRIGLNATELEERHREEREAEEAAERKRKENEVKDSSHKFFNRAAIGDTAAQLAQIAPLRGTRARSSPSALE